MYKNKVVGVVVPAYNEELLIGRVITTMPEYVDKIIIVDDHSKDGTVSIVKEYQSQDSERIVLLQHEQNKGVGGAIATGYLWCADNNIDAAAVMAGDAQMDPDDLEALLDPIVNGETDYAKGNRLFTGEAWRIIPRWRYLGNSVLSLLTKIASGYWHIADSQSGYTVINRKALRLINWHSMYTRYGQPNDLLVRLNVYNLRVRDVPIKPVYNIGEKSGIHPLKIIPKLSLLLAEMFLWRLYHKYIIRDFHPLVFFYVTGIILVGIGITYGTYSVLYRIFVSPLMDNSFLFSVFCFISGWQFLLFAMWFDMDYNKELKH